MEIDFSKIYSYSKLKLFENCPKQYYFNYLDPKIAPIKKQFKKQRDYQTKGQAVHGAITLFYHLPIHERTFDNLKICLEDAWFSEINPSQKFPLGKWGGFLSLEHEQKVYGDALRQLQNFFNLNDLNPSIFYLPTENIKDSYSDYERLIKPLNNRVSISGKFDRIDKLENGNLKIIDYKTGKEKKNQFQLYFYKLLAESNFESKVDTLSFYYLDKGKIENFDVSSINLDKIRKQVFEKITNIEHTQEFPPKPSGICEHCDFKEICPLYNSLDEIKIKVEEIENYNLKMPKSIYSKTVRASGKTYFFDIKESQSGDKYLQITESRLRQGGGRYRSNIVIFKEHFAEFRRALDEIAEKL